MRILRAWYDCGKFTTLGAKSNGGPAIDARCHRRGAPRTSENQISWIRVRKKEIRVRGGESLEASIEGLCLEGIL